MVMYFYFPPHSYVWQRTEARGRCGHTGFLSLQSDRNAIMKNITTHPSLVRDYLLALAGLPPAPPPQLALVSRRSGASVGAQMRADIR